METTIVGAQGSLLGPKQGKVWFLLEAYEKRIYSGGRLGAKGVGVGCLVQLHGDKGRNCGMRRVIASLLRLGTVPHIPTRRPAAALGTPHLEPTVSASARA